MKAVTSTIVKAIGLYHDGALRDLVPFVQFKKLALLHGCFSRILNCANGTKSRKASHIC